MRILFSFGCFIFSFGLLAQAQFEEEQLNQLLKEEINQFRVDKGLSELSNSDELDAAAFDQADFLKDASRIVHTQDKKKKETVEDRVKYFGGLYSNLGENASIVGIGSKSAVYPTGERVPIKTAQMAVAAAMQSWMDGKDSELNLGDKYFEHFGSAVLHIDAKLVIVVVFGGLPYQLPDGSREKLSDRGLNPPSKESCSDLWENFATTPQLFSDAFKVEGKSVYFEFHSLKLVEKIISSSSDGIGVDVISDEQFKCGSGNRIYPGEVHDGYLLPISKRGKLNGLNLAKEEGKIRLKLGEVPDFYDSTNCELNGLIIKNSAVCATVLYNRIKVLDLTNLKIPFQLIGDTLEEKLNWEDTLTLRFSGSENLKASSIVAELNAYLEDLNYQLKGVSIVQSFSPIQQNENRDLAEEIKQLLLQKQNESITIKTASNVAWTAYDKFQENTIYSIETKELDTLAKVAYLKKTAIKDSLLANFLDSLNEIKIVLSGRAQIDDKSTLQEKKEIFARLLKANKIKQALVLQRNMIEKLKAYTAVNNFIINQVPDNLQLISNQIVATVLSGKDRFQGNPIHLAFLELYLISHDYPILNYNKQLADLKWWGIDINTMSSPDNWEKSFNRINFDDTITEAEKARTYLNFYLLAANYYYNKGDFSNRKKSFDKLMKWYLKAAFTATEKLSIAQYLCYQDQFDRAIKLLLPEMKKEKPDEELLYYFLQIAIYEKEIVPPAQYLQIMKKAASIYPNHFCSFFNKDKRGIQALKDYDIKDLYCSQCK